MLYYIMVTCHSYICSLIRKFLWETRFVFLFGYLWKHWLMLTKLLEKGSLFWKILTSSTDACIIYKWTVVYWSVFGFQMYFIFDIILQFTITWPFIVELCAPQSNKSSCMMQNDTVYILMQKHWSERWLQWRE